MMFARGLCAIGGTLGLFMVICPFKIFKIQNIIRRILMINELVIGDFKIFIYRVGGIFEIFIFTILLTQTFPV